ncbi:hypothetical protein [Spirosoma panaciterrae]|nr:hypothetical protein [Spirosoma panaciterrae]
MAPETESQQNISLIIRHDNPDKAKIFEAFDRLTSGQDGDKP